MDNKIPNVATTIFDLSHKALADRKNWYSPAAQDYGLARPPYLIAVIQRVTALAGLTDRSAMLEIGCGLGTATVDFAPLVGSIDCLEPNPDFYQLAQANCAAHKLGQIAIDSGYFDHLVGGEVRVAVTYEVDRYLTLLNTYSPYLKLKAEIKVALLAALGEVINSDLGGSVDLQHTSAFHVTRRFEN
jgi:SAM-dependent methyltransferase